MNKHALKRFWMLFWLAGIAMTGLLRSVCAADERLVLERRAGADAELRGGPGAGQVSLREALGFLSAHGRVLAAVELGETGFLCVRSADGRWLHVYLNAGAEEAVAQWDTDFSFVDADGKELFSSKVLGAARPDKAPQLRRLLVGSAEPGITGASVTESFGAVCYEVVDAWPERAVRVRVKLMRRPLREKAWEVRSALYLTREMWTGGGRDGGK